MHVEPRTAYSLVYNLFHGAIQYETRSVAAGFGRHGMPPPASNETGTGYSIGPRRLRLIT